MGRGRKPIPTALKILRGNPGKRALPENEPKPDPTCPDCPGWLDRVAKAKWREIVPQLHAMGVATRIDGDALACYCQAWSRWRKAEEYLNSEGHVYESEKGPAAYPEVTIAKNLLLILNKLAAEFGMTASSRARVQVAKPVEAEDPLESLLQRKAR